MKQSLIASAAIASLCLGIVSRGSAAPSGKNQSQIAHGEYIVKGVGMCGDCHSRFTLTGGYVMETWLQGKKLEFGPLIPIPIWADTSPNIAGLPGWDTEKAVQFLMTGIAPNGQPARPPMPNYHMNRTDAEAVVAYLKSLKAPAAVSTPSSSGAGK